MENQRFALGEVKLERLNYTGMKLGISVENNGLPKSILRRVGFHHQLGSIR